MLSINANLAMVVRFPFKVKSVYFLLRINEISLKDSIKNNDCVLVSDTYRLNQ